jgi:D-alanyl-D-alanine dipeptidase
MIKIIENNEPLVDISKVCPEIVNGMDPLRKRYGDVLYLRQTVAQMLKKAHSLLPPGMTFIVLDAWRSKEAQVKFYDFYVNKFKEKNPSWNIDREKKEAGKYAISPNQIYKADHVSGGAIDLELIKNGKRLPIMARQLPFKDAVQTDCKNLPPNVRKTRQLLIEVMTQAGFTNYPEEYWHWCYGGYMWAELTGNKIAMYGTIDK